MNTKTTSQIKSFLLKKKDTERNVFFSQKKDKNDLSPEKPVL